MMTGTEQLKDPKMRVVGTKQVLRAIAENKVSQVFLGKDSDGFLYHRIQRECEGKPFAVNTQYTMAEIGSFCAIDVPSAVAATLK